MKSTQAIAYAIARKALPPADRRRAIRLDAGLSQDAMAVLVGDLLGRAGRPTRSAVCRWESGDRTPRGRVALAYAEALVQLEVIR